MRQIEVVSVDGIILDKPVSAEGAVWRRLDNEVDIYWALWGEEAFFTEEEAKLHGRTLEGWMLEAAAQMQLPLLPVGE